MSKIEKELNCNFDELLQHIENGILNGSLSATLEDSSDFIQENGRCSVRVFERYSAFGNNRVSLNVTLFQSDNNPNQYIRRRCVFRLSNQCIKPEVVFTSDF